MNSIRRTAIKKATQDFKDKLEALCAEYAEKIRDLANEEREALDNLPESLQYSEKGGRMEECADALDGVVEELESCEDVLDSLYINEMLEVCEVGP